MATWLKSHSFWQTQIHNIGITTQVFYISVHTYKYNDSYTHKYIQVLYRHSNIHRPTNIVHTRVYTYTTQVANIHRRANIVHTKVYTCTAK